jgi:putative phosphoribosyl transferase
MSALHTITDRSVAVRAGDVTLNGQLALPEGATGIVLFAHGSGSSRHSHRNQAVAQFLNDAGLGTLLFDLLTEDEEREDQTSARLRFDIPLLARRVGEAAGWLANHDATRGLPVGAFGASTGGGAALMAAVEQPGRIVAVVSRGGRPDLAGEALSRVDVPTLLIVGERDVAVIELNRQAMDRMERADVHLEIVEGATHLFEEPGAIDEVARLAAEFFLETLGSSDVPETAVVRRPDGASDSSGDDADAAGEMAGDMDVYRTPAEIARLVRAEAQAFDDVDTADLQPLLERIGDAKVVCLGEATHGTSEFYRMRDRITRALIEEKGFTVVAVEADWPDAERVDEYVRHRTRKVERPWDAFARFPDWMWRNLEVIEMVEWLRETNAERPERQRAGFYGLDLYSMYTSIGEVIDFLDEREPELADIARERYGCLLPFSTDPAEYGAAVVSQRHRDCEDEAAAMLHQLLRKRMRLHGGSGERLFDATQNARVVQGAEQYYRVMYYGSPESWNLRDTHMFETLQAVRAFRDGGKAVVWAHNSHLGDAQATQMGQRGEINLGHLCREEYGDRAYLIGFGTHTGTVCAASNWGEPVEEMKVRPSHAESYEWLCHTSGVPRFFLPLRYASRELRYELGHPRLERAIGVIYRPATELQSHYFHAILPRQFDEFVWFDESRAVRPLDRSRAPELPNRHPFGLLGD